MDQHKERKETQNLNKSKYKIYKKLAKIDQNWHYYAIFEYPYVVFYYTYVVSDF